jgi:putative transcriptional regulator
MNNRLRVFRRQKKLTQAKLAKEAQVSRQTIIAIEQGDYTPSVALALKLATKLECEVTDLFILTQKDWKK